MARLIVVSNRVALPEDQAGRAGGLAVALREALVSFGGIWFGWSGKVAAQTSDRPRFIEEGPVTYAVLDLGRKDHAQYYNGFANRTLWPLFHYRMGLAEFTRQDYEGYMRVNTVFAEQLQPLLTDDDLIWVHDYHLIPLGGELRRLGARQRMGIFLHTPFPAMEVLLALTHHRRLVGSLCAYDVVGFQTENDRRSFFDYVLHEAGGWIGENGHVTVWGRSLVARVYPIGIEKGAFAEAAQRAQRTVAYRRLRASLNGRKLMIGVERLDYSKGLPERFEAFSRLLEKHPEHRAKVSFMQVAPISRSEVPEYRRLREELESLSGQINGQFGDYDWVPIRYLTRNFARSVLAGFYRQGAVGVVTPMRDGMNLVAKEYVASQNPQDPGVLVLSRFAGAARELTTALQVNPFDREDMADAMDRALGMALDERKERWVEMMRMVDENSLEAWREKYLADLNAAPFNG
ncbi:alpha,alpha-trehalose-phosphate synthase (UDP-forming) [Rhodospirillum rubrum]|uniref:Trehalose-6-phosphate synthase n=1 Tax=Rhodospirillum rubrum (strain ATCC 11170 / ATH 1.1.1 / DSM 467 / LMG 4362 / NCIMB 8255 / S1) TaxID=269796 RepID=Q2RRG0_RHORT|nr:trehalose-6-phosphate synthase [Rhodospirillum rubrum]ABC23285.1 Alpha,alpha-trehalose-phosphate synthase (UDP-forming) [Rhodospirillum rubrum ATCC 11170]AEO49017.1 alpha,alpha-trehalose-phosphate synthase (UDP-forming) [Rhodospirillum rubrum F11]MBK5954955.1 trehalose-6-phosphate synthase [Rhodospirillum rubrum]QXG79260.1 trehalose-6-phosphate synthase [Rhodospirillum rubrum]HAP98656.1 trehalose-6-phosphate synthase [Rhodospirillum rubrum]